LVCLAEEAHQWMQLTAGFLDVPDGQLEEMRN
jgi:hypothetical protein